MSDGDILKHGQQQEPELEHHLNMSENDLKQDKISCISSMGFKNGSCHSLTCNDTKSCICKVNISPTNDGLNSPSINSSSLLSPKVSKDTISESPTKVEFKELKCNNKTGDQNDSHLDDYRPRTVSLSSRLGIKQNSLQNDAEDIRPRAASLGSQGHSILKRNNLLRKLAGLRLKSRSKHASFSENVDVLYYEESDDPLSSSSTESSTIKLNDL